MSDYISRQAAIDETCKGCNIEFPNEGCEPSDCEIKKRLINIHAADVVEVVRCKDCKYRDTTPDYNIFLGGGCRWHESESPDDDDYCSYGERADK